MTWSKAMLRRHPAFTITESPRLAAAVPERVSENETLKGFWEPLNEEYLGWGVHRDDSKLLTQVNFILRNWKKNGTLKEVLSKWLPYWKTFD